MINEETRFKLLSNVKGHVLEVGVGTGANLSCYPEDIALTAVDFSPAMLELARKKADRLKLKVNLLEMDAQRLDFPDNTFDFVVSTCVFCSVPDPVAGLKELFRVCKPDGKVLMLEHMRSEHPFVGKIMDLLNPLTVRMTGANINRRTLDHIERAGLLIEENEKLFFTIFRKLELRPDKGEEDE